MTAPMLKTKLFIPPVRARQVHRPRLIELLNEGRGKDGSFAHKLTLISAPGQAFAHASSGVMKRSVSVGRAPAAVSIACTWPR